MRSERRRPQAAHIRWSGEVKHMAGTIVGIVSLAARIVVAAVVNYKMNK